MDALLLYTNLPSFLSSHSFLPGPFVNQQQLAQLCQLLQEALSIKQVGAAIYDIAQRVPSLHRTSP